MRATYLVLLGLCVVGTLPLEFLLGTRVYGRPRRWLLALAPVFVVFAGWDVWAIHQGHWSYDRRQTSGVVFPGRLPLEEVLFFLVIPTCAILAFEAVRAVRGWPAGDEPPEQVGPHQQTPPRRQYRPVAPPATADERPR